MKIKIKSFFIFIGIAFCSVSYAMSWFPPAKQNCNPMNAQICVIEIWVNPNIIDLSEPEIPNPFPDVGFGDESWNLEAKAFSGILLSLREFYGVSFKVKAVNRTTAKIIIQARNSLSYDAYKIIVKTLRVSLPENAVISATLITERAVNTLY